MIDRPLAAARVHELFRSHPCVAILGPRQCGKTTLARMISAGETAVSFFDLESPVDARRLEAPLAPSAHSMDWSSSTKSSASRSCSRSCAFWWIGLTPGRDF